MSSRRRAREFALQVLFARDLGQGKPGPALEDLWTAWLEDEEATEPPPEEEEVAFAKRLIGGVEERQSNIDQVIESASTNWRLARMPVVDRNILRLAVFELIACPDIPPNVSINEAVELAKKFGTSESKGFVNGILDRVARESGRAAAPRRSERA